MTIVSADLIAIFDVSSDLVSLEWLRDAIEADSHFAEDIIALYREHWQPQTWAIDASERALYGPGGFALRLKPRLLKLYHMMPFSRFAADSELREMMRRSCRSLASLVGSDRVLFTHELMPIEGHNLAAIESSLRARIGPPAADFEELSQAEYFGPHAWFLDCLSGEG